MRSFLRFRKDPNIDYDFKLDQRIAPSKFLMIDFSPRYDRLIRA